MEKKNLSKQVSDDIYRMITETGELRPGGQLPGELALCEQFGVSRTTVREAIKDLVSRGILKVYRGKGTFVSDEISGYLSFGLDELDMNKSRLKDLFEARLLFEPQLAALACRRASAEELAEILKAGKAVEDFVLSNRDRTEADQEFHKKIAVASHNRFMLQLVPIIHSTISEAILLRENQQILADTTVRDHGMLMQFMEKRDAEGTREAMAIHLRNAMSILGISK